MTILGRSLRALLPGLVAGAWVVSFSGPSAATPTLGYRWPTQHITIVDGVAWVSPPIPEWEVVRNTVLMHYMAAGFSFTVVEAGPIYCPTTPEPGTIVLCYGQGWRMEPYADGDHISAATLVIQRDRGLFCHELGHALGLGHYNRKPTQRSCMWGLEHPRPSPGDIATLRRMYHV